MESGRTILSVECSEPEGPIVRDVKQVSLTKEKLYEYYEKISQFNVVFNDLVPNDPVTFASIFLGQEADGTFFAKGLIWEVDDVGIIYITDLDSSSCLAHFTFWDKRLRGREKLIRESLKYGFERYGFERIEVRVPLYSKPVLNMIERVGLTKEGRLRNATRFDGQWFDVNIYSVLREELLNGSAGKDSRTA